MKALVLLACIACGPLPWTDPGSERVTVVSPCDGDFAFRARPEAPLDPAGRCWVTMLGASGQKYQHPFRATPEQCPYRCDRAGLLYFVVDDAGATQVAGVVWDDQVLRPGRGLEPL